MTEEKNLNIEDNPWGDEPLPDSNDNTTSAEPVPKVNPSSWAGLVGGSAEHVQTTKQHAQHTQPPVTHYGRQKLSKPREPRPQRTKEEQDLFLKLLPKAREQMLNELLLKKSTVENELTQAQYILSNRRWDDSWALNMFELRKMHYRERNPPRGRQRVSYPDSLREDQLVITDQETGQKVSYSRDKTYQSRHFQRELFKYYKPLAGGRKIDVFTTNGGRTFLRIYVA